MLKHCARRDSVTFPSNSRETPMMSPRRLLAFCIILSTTVLHAAASPPIESMPTLNATMLAPSSLLNGAGYTVDINVPVVGYMGQFVLRAPAGTFLADGTEMLAIRVGELAAIGQLSQLSQSGVFADALAASAVRTGAAIGQAVMNPVETISGIPAGVGRFFQSAATTISRATESSPSGDNSAQGGGASNAARGLLGVNRAIRRIAKQVGADPYTTNPVLAKQLDDLARASVAGGISLDVALAVSTAGVGTAISATATASNLVWEKSPEDIRAINENKLAAMGVGPDTVRAFVTNRWLTPTLSVPFVEHLTQIPAAKGRAAVVGLASTVASEGEARFMLNAVSIARQIGTERDPVIALELTGRILVVRTRSGRMDVPAPVDYVVWTAPVRAFAERNSKGTQRNILITGFASAAAREGLHATGWAIQDIDKLTFNLGPSQLAADDQKKMDEAVAKAHD
jgi:hypothetical protein